MDLWAKGSKDFWVEPGRVVDVGSFHVIVIAHFLFSSAFVGGHPSWLAPLRPLRPLATHG